MSTLEELKAQAPPHDWPESTNDYVAKLPWQRYTALAQGMLLLLPRTGLVVVPIKMHSGGWDVAVVVGDETYKRGGYHLSIGDREIETAVELDVASANFTERGEDHAERT